MKQLHNIVAPLILFCLMAAVSLPVLAQEQEGETVAQQTQDEISCLRAACAGISL